MSGREDMRDHDGLSGEADAEAKMLQYGIRRVPVDTFHYRHYRYSSLKDAVAQAKRDASGVHINES